MSNQRAVKKQLMKFKSLDTKMVEHFFHKKKLTGSRTTSMIGKYKFRRAAG